MPRPPRPRNSAASRSVRPRPTGGGGSSSPWPMSRFARQDQDDGRERMGLLDRDGDSARDPESLRKEAERELERMAQSGAWPMRFPTLEEAKATKPGDLKGL